MRGCSWNHARKVSESLWRDGNRCNGRPGVNGDPQSGRGEVAGAKTRAGIPGLAAAIAIPVAKSEGTVEIDGLQSLQTAGLGKGLDAGWCLKADHDEQACDHDADQHLRMAP